MLKRTITVALALVLLLCLLPAPAVHAGGGGAALRWEEEFSSASALSAWTVIDANRDGYSFAWGGPTNDHNSGCVRSGLNVGGAAIDPILSDDWLISPAITLGDGEYNLQFQVSGFRGTNDWVPYEVYVYTGTAALTAANIRSRLTQPLARETWIYWSGDQAPWKWMSFDLTPWKGKEIRLVFRHYAQDAGQLCLDDVRIYWHEPDELLDKVTAFRVPEPAAGVSVADCKESAIRFDSNANYELVPGSLTYYRTEEESSVPFTGVFAYGEEYGLSFLVRPKAGIDITDTGIASVNNRAAFFQPTGNNTVKVWYYPGWLREPIPEVSFYVEQPVGGRQPVPLAYAYDRTTFSPSQVTYHEIDASGNLGKQVGDYDTFTAGKTYRARVRLSCREELAFAASTRVTINGVRAVPELLDSGEGWYTADLKALSPGAVKAVEEINLKISMPEPGEVFETYVDQVAVTFLDAEPHYAVAESAWYYENGVTDPVLEFRAGFKYFAELGLRAAPGWKLTNDTVVTINGKPADYFAQSNVVIWDAASAPRYVGNPFRDVKDSKYYYDAVLWAYYHRPQITGGTGDGTTFSPNESCTRAQVMTFLWNACGAPAPASAYNPFSDVKSGKYYYDAVLWAYHHSPQITGGLSTTTFGVKSPCTRAQVVMFLWAAAGKPEPTTTENPFSDVKSTDYYYKAVLWAVENGVTGGTTAATFSPKQTCTRGQVVTFLYKADWLINPDQYEEP